MDKPSDRLDYIEKVFDLRNFFLDCQKQTIIRDIMWLENNSTNFEALKGYFAGLLKVERVLQLDFKSLQELAEIRGNFLYSQLRGLEHQKTETTPLKIIVQELKAMGQ